MGVAESLYILSPALKARLDRVSREAERILSGLIRFEEYIALPYFGQIILRFGLDRSEVSLSELDEYERVLYGIVGDEFLVDFMGSAYRSAGVDYLNIEDRFVSLAEELKDEKLYPSVHGEGILRDAQTLLKEAGLSPDSDVWEIQAEDGELLLLVLGETTRMLGETDCGTKLSYGEVKREPCLGLIRAAFFAKRKGLSLARLLKQPSGK